MDLSKFASNQKILSGVILHKVTLDVTWTQSIYIYIYIYIYYAKCTQRIDGVEW